MRRGPRGLSIPPLAKSAWAKETNRMASGSGRWFETSGGRFAFISVPVGWERAICDWSAHQSSISVDFIISTVRFGNGRQLRRELKLVKFDAGCGLGAHASQLITSSPQPFPYCQHPYQFCHIGLPNNCRGLDLAAIFVSRFAICAPKELILFATARKA